MPRPAVVYIGGNGRSGSTILAQLVGRHAGFAAVGELRYALERGVLANHLCGCGTPFRECAFWTEVFTRLLGGFDTAQCEELLAGSRRLDRIRYAALLVAPPGARPPGFRKRLDQHAEFLLRLYTTIAEVTGAEAVVDSSKDPSYAFLLRSVAGLDVSVVHLVRDSRAVAYSWTRAKVRPEIHWQVEYMRRRSPLRSALVWTGCNLLFEAIRHQHDPYLRVKYEDFTSEPARHVAEIVEWAGGSSSPGMADSETPFRHDISGNPIRFATEIPVVKLDEEWKKRMPNGQRRLVTLVTAPLLVRYRYSLNTRVGARRGGKSRIRGIYRFLFK